MHKTKQLLLNRIMAVLLVVFMLLPSMSVFATSGSTVSVGTASGQPGDQVSVTVSVSGNPGIAYLKLKIGYDASQLTLTGATNSGLLTGTFTTSKTTDTNPYVLQWMGAENATGNGVAATLTFQIASNASAGDKAISVSVDECYNESFDDVTLSPSNGKVTVESKPTKTLTSISVQTNPTKTTYEIGEALNTSGLTLKLNYSDGSTEIISSGFTTSGFSSEIAGTKVVTVSYNGKSTTFYVTINNTPSVIIAQGICGDNLAWILDSSGTLTVSGNGEMYDYYHQSYDGKTPPPWADYSSIKSVIISDGVQSIGDYAFWRYPFENITISKTVNSIGEHGICGCTSLEAITVENGNPFYHSSGNCLIETQTKTLVVGCKNSVIPTDDSVTKIGSGAFAYSNYPYTLTIPSNITSIGEEAFMWCSITNIRLNDGLVDIDEFAFYGCPKITSINIPNTVKNIGNSAFANCNKLSSITLPQSTMSISSGSFNNTPYYNNTANWENNVLYIGTHLIVAKSSITEHYVKDGTIDIASSAFYGTSLAAVSIPDSVNRIGRNAFVNTPYYNNTANWENDLLYIDNHLIAAKNTIAGELKIKDYTKTISYYAFYNCTNLKSITIPYSVVYIDNMAFYKCNNVESINVEDGNSYYNTSGNCLIETETETLILGCKNSVFPTDGSITRIEDYAFYGCRFNIVTIPEGVISIGKYAFYGCTSLKSLTIPKSVTEIGANAFGYCMSLESIKVTSGNTVYRSLGNCLIETASKTLLVGCKNSVIPNDGSVTKIANNAFSEVFGLESIIIPNNVVSIGNMAFYRCYLKNITISKDVTDISEDAFYDNSGIEKIVVDGENKVYSSSGNCLIETKTKKLILGCKNSVIPDDGAVISIGEEAFYDCTGLESLVIPDDVTSIGRYAFGYCWNLKAITIPKSVTTIDKTTFSNCNNVIIYGYLDSFAHTYAENNSIPFLALDGRNVISISVESLPAKTQYYIGDSLNTSGLSIKLTYNDGSIENITSGFTTSGFSSSTSGTKTITVTHSGKTTTFNVTVNTPSIILSSTSKSMTVGGTAKLTTTTTPSGQTVTWTSSNTSVATVSGGTITAKASGSATITAKFTYNGNTYSKTCSVTVTSAPNPEPTLSSISIATKPTKTSYEIGESLNTSGLTLKLTYSDGSTETVSSGFTTSGFGSATSGTKTVTVSYGGKTTTFTVTVKAISVPEDSAQLIMSSSDTMAGKEVTLTLSVKNNPGIAGLAISLKYDENVLTLKETKNGGLFSGFTAAKNFAWDESENVTNDGVLATFIFTVAEDAPAGDYNIEVLIRSCTNENLDDVELLTTNGIVSVIDFVYGDSNGDQKIDMKDVVLLRKYITNFDYDTNTSSVNVELGADANGDNKIDMKDVVILRKYITNYDYDTESSTVVLGPQ